MLGRVSTRVFAVVSSIGLGASSAVVAQSAAAEVVYHDVQYSIEAAGGGSSLLVRYTGDLRDHADPTEKHLVEEAVELPWTVDLKIGESDFGRAGRAPDSKPFKGLDLGLTGIANGTSLGDDALVDGNGRLQGPEAWNAWTGGDARGSSYTCRITVDGEVVAEQTMKGLCSAQYKRRVSG
ncbi:MAG: hypothetical protein ACRC20_16720 [Segniliparus sp.]|uniref:hypothetical protein n=1 Tax=Segniliparus sp. TaxID=2804064 RepID=UPI003F336FAD